MQYLRLFFATLAVLAVTFMPFGEISAESISDTYALADLNSAKGIFLVDIGDPKKLAFYLNVIKGTHAGMIRQNVTPDFVVVFIGPSVQQLTTSPKGDIALEYGDTLESIAGSVADLKQLGIRQEICGVATKVFDINNKTILPELNLVGDGFISLIRYQIQGYALVPVY